ncbi:mechanosensitive ion channel family protein [Algoriphagus antarcticus]|uniref:Small-conductance mechanosensitive channel n=1 Tax=Algoriphagus antarcticus TaxID=238540 RepID=A0A3E0DN11_9BACT|nr:mechanosensitive ion channel family protein [Algoriphagus antarcticus]REG83555.1 small-conductance mechanosensitive channel [Algoriphagus antarcticus]
MIDLQNFSIDWPSVQHWVILFGIALGTLLLFIFLSRKSKIFLEKRLTRKMDDDLLANFLAGIFASLVVIMGIMIVLRIIGLTGIVSGMLAGAGISAFIIGFALKDIGENFLAGILLAFKRPFKIGDIIDIGGIRGQVLSLNLRDTQIKTLDGKDVFLPNSLLIKNPLVNFTIDGYLRYDFMVGLDYGSDYLGAMGVIDSALRGIPGILEEKKKVTVRVNELAESTLNIEINFWVDTLDNTIGDLDIKSTAILSVLTALEKAGFNLPAKIIELKTHKGDSLKTS